MLRRTAPLILLGLAALAPVRTGAAQPASAPPAAIAGDEEAGREVYAANCRSCHSGAIAPPLSGVVGRPAASAPGYAYSDALKAKAAEPWTEARLDAFLIGPQAYAPGTRMLLVVPDAQKRADLIAYLKSLSDT